MELKEILAISKLPGLYRIVTSRDNGLIVTPLGEDKRKFVASRQHMFTPLENITIYTNIDSIELSKVFELMKTNEGTIALPDAKADDKALRTYFTSLVPDHDQQRVYVTDIKKMIKWYKALDTEGVIVLEKEEAKPAAKKTTAKAKPAAKKASATKAKSTTKADSEAKPKKATKKAPKSEK